jgi:hypothetical protein
MRDITWDKIREIRSYLLKKSDWTQLSDIDLNEEDKQKWISYRKELRDITKNFRNPTEVIWPDLP